MPTFVKHLIFDPHALGLDVAKVSDGEALVICPFHNDTKPSASFNLEKGLLHCFACGTDMAAAAIAKALGSEVSKVTHFTLLKSEYESGDGDIWQWVLSQPLARNNKYLKSRAVTEEQVEKFSIREFPEGVAFIYSNARGRPIGAQLRFSTPTSATRYLHLGEKPPLWPFVGSLESSSMILVEGIFGVLRADLHGVQAFSVNGAQSIIRAAEHLKGIRRKLIFFDDDKAGQLATAKALSLNEGFETWSLGNEVDNAGLAFFLFAQAALNVESHILEHRSTTANHFIKRLGNEREREILPLYTKWLYRQARKRTAS